MPATPLVLGFTGPSGSGKTTLLELLIAELVTRERRVGVVKHASHGIEADRPGKDSWRLYESGARAVALAGPDQLATFTRHAERAPSLADALATLPEDLDVVLVEGYLSEPVPRYLVLPPNGEEERGYRDSGPLLRVIEAPPALGGPPRFDPVLVKEIANEIERALDQPG